jgi:hypothetical protein
MDLVQAKTTLDDLRRNDPVIQRGRNGELTTAFKAFWDSGPDEATFAKHTAGLLITPSLLYYMVENPIWMRKDVESEKESEKKDDLAAQGSQDKKGGKHAPR